MDLSNSLGLPSTRVEEASSKRVEATSDRYGEDERTIPGNALTVAPNSPFRALQREGNAFLSRFEGSLCASPLLEHVSLIDTPGVLSGEKQRVARHYDFDAAAGVKGLLWFSLSRITRPQRAPMVPVASSDVLRSIYGPISSRNDPAKSPRAFLDTGGRAVVRRARGSHRALV